MKTIFLLMVMSFVLVGENSFPIMMEIKGEEKIPEDFRLGVAEGLTTKNYSLIDSKAQDEALKEQSEMRKKGCYDDECLVDTGKMLAARGLVVVDVKKRDKLFTFSVRYIDFETGALTKTLTRYYKDSLENYEILNEFGRSLVLELFGTSKEEIREEKQKETKIDKQKQVEDLKKQKIEEKIKDDKNIESFQQIKERINLKCPNMMCDIPAGYVIMGE